MYLPKDVQDDQYYIIRLLIAYDGRWLCASPADWPDPDKCVNPEVECVNRSIPILGRELKKWNNIDEFPEVREAVLIDGGSYLDCGSRWEPWPEEPLPAHLVEKL